MAGMCRELGFGGRVVIPSEARASLGLRVGTPMEILLDAAAGEIGLQALRTGCLFCGNVRAEELGTRGLRVCVKCCVAARGHMRQRVTA